jgi:hypothetical protein
MSFVILWVKFIFNRPNIFTILRCKDELFCPVRALEVYYRKVTLLGTGVSLKVGYLIWPIASGKVVNAPPYLWYLQAASPLSTGSRLVFIYEGGSTEYSLRSGSVVGLQAAGLGITASMHHIGSSTENSARHYARISSLVSGKTFWLVVQKILLMIALSPSLFRSAIYVFVFWQGYSTEFMMVFSPN